MSEVSLRAAFGVYRKYGPSNSLIGLLHGIAEGRRLYGSQVYKIFSFKDIDGTVQLFYCQEPGEDRRVLNSSNLKELCEVYTSGSVGSLPSYLTREYESVRRAEVEEAANQFKILSPIALENLGDRIADELKQHGWRRTRTYQFTFSFMFGEDTWVVGGKYDSVRSNWAGNMLDDLKSSLEKKGCRCWRLGTGSTEECLVYKTERFDLDRFHGVGRELAEAVAAYGEPELAYIKLERRPLLSKTQKRIALIVSLLAIVGLVVLLFVSAFRN